METGSLSDFGRLLINKNVNKEYTNMSGVTIRPTPQELYKRNFNRPNPNLPASRQQSYMAFPPGMTGKYNPNTQSKAIYPYYGPYEPKSNKSTKVILGLLLAGGLVFAVSKRKRR